MFVAKRFFSGDVIFTNKKLIFKLVGYRTPSGIGFGYPVPIYTRITRETLYLPFSSLVLSGPENSYSVFLASVYLLTTAWIAPLTIFTIALGFFGALGSSVVQVVLTLLFVPPFAVIFIAYLRQIQGKNFVLYLDSKKRLGIVGEKAELENMKAKIEQFQRVYG